jgi:hypothetical protein
MKACFHPLFRACASAHAFFYFTDLYGKVMMMEKRLRDVIDAIDYSELLRMKSDLTSGGHHLRKFIEGEIRSREMQHSEYCSNCSAEIDAKSTTTFTLLFGPSDFRKKASFCGKDCLQYFVSKMDEMKKGMMPKTAG